MAKARTQITPRQLFRTREIKIAKLVSRGLKNEEIADRLGTTRLYVNNLLRPMYEKLGFTNRVEIALWYIKNFEA